MVFFDSEKIGGKGVADIASDTEGMSPVQKLKYFYDYMHSEEYINDIENIKAQKAADDNSEGREFGGRGEEDISAQNNKGIDTDNALSENNAVNADGVNKVVGVGDSLPDASNINKADENNVINGENDIANGDKVEYKENNINILKHKIIKQLQAEEINNWWKSKRKYKNPPYKPGTNVDHIELNEKSNFVRVYDKDNSDMVGQWIMRAEDIKGLTPKEIKDKYALPFIPKFICDVKLEVGTQLRIGIANEVTGWGKGGGIQYDLMGQIIGEFKNERLLK